MVFMKKCPLLRDSWKVPRGVVCSMFWTAVFILFVGMILLVISKHKTGKTYIIWGGVLLGLGFCLVFICFLLCLNAYRILSQKNKLPQTTAIKFNLAMPPSSTSIIHNTPAVPSKPLNYPHIFVPIHPSHERLETSEEKSTPALKRDVYQANPSSQHDISAPGSASELISRDSNHQSCENVLARKKKVRLQNGKMATFDEDTLTRPEEILHAEEMREDKMFRSVPNFGSNNYETRDLRSEDPQINTSILATSAARKQQFPPRTYQKHVRHKSRDEIACENYPSNEIEEICASTSRNPNKQWSLGPPGGSSNKRNIDDEMQNKYSDRSHHSRSKTMPQALERFEDAETLIENIGSMRVKVRPIRSRLYMPEWEGDSNSGSQRNECNNSLNIIHF